jgi:hypothetical protein
MKYVKVSEIWAIHLSIKRAGGLDNNKNLCGATPDQVEGKPLGRVLN